MNAAAGECLISAALYLAVAPSRWCQYTGLVAVLKRNLRYLFSAGFQQVLNDETPNRENRGLVHSNAGRECPKQFDFSGFAGCHGVAETVEGAKVMLFAVQLDARPPYPIPCMPGYAWHTTMVVTLSRPIAVVLRMCGETEIRTPVVSLVTINVVEL